jgi:hypothetical protein
MTNELSSFDEFNGISSCLDNTIRFLLQQSKKMKTPIRFLSQQKSNGSFHCFTVYKLVRLVFYNMPYSGVASPKWALYQNLLGGPFYPTTAKPEGG